MLILLSTQLTNLIEEKSSSPHDYNKFKIYIDQLDTVLKLLLKVSAQLARAQNAVMSLPDGTDNQEMVCIWVMIIGYGSSVNRSFFAQLYRGHIWVM